MKKIVLAVFFIALLSTVAFYMFESKDEPEMLNSEDMVDVVVNENNNNQVETTVTTNTFTLTSESVVDGVLAMTHTCDGDSTPPHLSWSGAPVDTVSYVVIMDHSPEPGEYKWYWTVYNLGSEVREISANDVPGEVGTNSVGRNPGYEPPCSQGPGAKEYTLTVYALDTMLNLEPIEADRATLLSMMKDHILSTATLVSSVTRTQN